MSRRAAAAYAAPPSVGGETIMGRDYEAGRVALYRSEMHPLAELVRMRKEAADEIERLMAFLDATEGDTDAEDGADSEPDMDDEPSLGWTRAGAFGDANDLEEASL